MLRSFNLNLARLLPSPPSARERHLWVQSKISSSSLQTIFSSLGLFVFGQVLYPSQNPPASTFNEAVSDREGWRQRPPAPTSSPLVLFLSVVGVRTCAPSFFRPFKGPSHVWCKPSGLPLTRSPMGARPSPWGTNNSLRAISAPSHSRA